MSHFSGWFIDNIIKNNSYLLFNVKFFVFSTDWLLKSPTCPIQSRCLQMSMSILTVEWIQLCIITSLWLETKPLPTCAHECWCYKNQNRLLSKRLPFYATVYYSSFKWSILTIIIVTCNIQCKYNWNNECALLTQTTFLVCWFVCVYIIKMRFKICTTQNCTLNDLHFI